MAVNQSLQKKFEEIAKQHLDVETLAERKSDRLDFIECSVWGIQAALEAAYHLGLEQGRKAKRTER
jgi:hypothetical protein